MDARNMKRREINKYVKLNFAPSWIYYCTGMHVQQHIKYLVDLSEIHVQAVDLKQ